MTFTDAVLALPFRGRCALDAVLARVAVPVPQFAPDADDPNATTLSWSFADLYVEIEAGPDGYAWFARDRVTGAYAGTHAGTDGPEDEPVPDALVPWLERLRGAHAPEPTPAEKAQAVLADPEARQALYGLVIQARSPWPSAIVPSEIRLQDGVLDEVVGLGFFHLEQMDDGHWWMQLGDVHVNLATKNGRAKIHGRAERDP